MISDADRQLLVCAEEGSRQAQVLEQAFFNGSDPGAAIDSPRPVSVGLTRAGNFQALGETLIACSAVALLLTIKPGKAIV
ncbi:hypothetical protein ACOYXF_05230 [Pseudomonas sp. Tul1A2]|uniref:hypothetical protein n=1 Tax=Pseudomonas fluorescens TaxID=294 RepID=UPI0012425DFE|nr:hypothetical protein [Pseudomonas fluorescens]